MSRKIVQIQAFLGQETIYRTDHVVALCDDGTVWQCTRFNEWSDWELLQEIPQEDISEIRELQNDN